MTLPCAMNHGSGQTVGAYTSSDDRELPFCFPHLEALPGRLQERLFELSEASIFELDAHADATAVVEQCAGHLRKRKTVPGVCSVCGCTDDFACPEGCTWANKAHTLCSACDGR